MISEFILAPRSEQAALTAVKDKVGWHDSRPIEIGDFVLAHPGSEENISRGSLARTRNRITAVVGQFHNREAMRSLLAIYDSSALTAGDAQLLAIALDELGEASLALFEGPYVCLVGDTRSDAVSVFPDPMGHSSAYVTDTRSPWVTSHLKLHCARDDFTPNFAPEQVVVASEDRSDDFCPVMNVHRVKPGTSIRISQDGSGVPILESHLRHRLQPQPDHHVPEAEALRLVRDLMESAVRCRVEGEARLAIPLSGGVDSSLVAGLASRSVSDLSTVSIGTELSNEFEYADIVAKHLGTRHQFLTLTNSEIMTGVVESIYGNEIYDGYSSEVQAALFALYRRLSGQFDTLVTGYGADLLFGGILEPQAPTREANQLLWKQVYRTRWTGEFSASGAHRFGLDVRHPFWSTRVVAFCLNLDAALKVSDRDIKVILKRYASEEGLVPQSIIARKKVGIHEGSSVNRIFSEFLGTHGAAHDEKTRFSYFVYKRCLEGSTTSKNLDPIDLRDLYRQRKGA